MMLQVVTTTDLLQGIAQATWRRSFTIPRLTQFAREEEGWSEVDL